MVPRTKSQKEEKTEDSEEAPQKEWSVKDLDGIGEVKGNKLISAGINTPQDIIIRGAEEMDTLTELGRDACARMVEKVQAQLVAEGRLPNIRGRGWQEYSKKIMKIPSGSAELDNMLGGMGVKFNEDGTIERDKKGEPVVIQMPGGIETQAVTEVFAEEGGGKTQFCFTLLVEALKMGHGVMFVDCEGTFDLDRVQEIAAFRGVDLNMDKLFIEKVFDSTSLMRVIDSATKTILENDIKLIIVDGGTGLFRYEFQQGRGDLAPRQNQMKPFFLHLKKTAFWLNVAVVLTNQVMGNPDPFSGSPIKAIGGHIVGHAPKYILWFRKNSKNKRTVVFEKSNRHARFEAVIYLTQKGLSDTPE